MTNLHLNGRVQVPAVTVGPAAPAVSTVLSAPSAPQAVLATQGANPAAPYFDPTLVARARMQASAIAERTKDPARLALRLKNGYDDLPLVRELQKSLRALRERTGQQHGFSLEHDNLVLTEVGIRRGINIFRDYGRVPPVHSFRGWTELGDSVSLVGDETVEARLRDIDTRLAAIAQDVEHNAFPMPDGAVGKKKKRGFLRLFKSERRRKS